MDTCSNCIHYRLQIGKLELIHVGHGVYKEAAVVRCDFSSLLYDKDSPACERFIDKTTFQHVDHQENEKSFDEDPRQGKFKF